MTLRILKEPCPQKISFRKMSRNKKVNKLLILKDTIVKENTLQLSVLYN